MRICRLFLVVLLCAVTCFALFSVSSFATDDVQCSYNGIVLPKIPEQFTDDGSAYISVIVEYSDTYVCCLVEPDSLPLMVNDENRLAVGDFIQWRFIDGQWVSKKIVAAFIPVWSSVDIYLPDGETVFLQGTEPSAWPPPEPMTVSKLMPNIVSIFSSCITWVKSVGSTILEKPILLFYAVLPLCGIGVGFFKRLKS